LVIALVVVIGGGTGAYFLFSGGGGKTDTASGGGGQQPRASSPKSPDDSTELGTLSTLDPCSLVDTSGLGGTADAYPNDLGACFVYDTPEGSQQITTLSVSLGVEQLSKVDTSSFTVTKQNKATIVKAQQRNDDTDCFAQVFFASDAYVYIQAKPDSGNSAPSTSAELCQLADTATTTVASKVNSGGVKHLAFPSSSMGSINACSLLTAAAVRTAVTGPGTATPYPGEHSCFWGSDSTTPQPSAFFGTELDMVAQQASDSPGETQVTVNGRPTLLTPFPASGSDTLNSCQAATPVHTWPSWLGQMTPTDSGSTKLIEYAHVSAAVSGGVVQACASAIELARQAWTKLPAAS
jgi:hypothetical protein